MTDETQILTKAKRDHSHIFCVSVRGWIALMVIGTVCFMSLEKIKIEEPMYTLVGMVAGFYLAQGNKPKAQQ
jgi:hypothetical protein